MLPFLKRTKEASASSSDPVLRKADDEAPFDSLFVAAQDMLAAIAKKDPHDLAAAIRAAFDLCDMQPHEEGPHQ